MAIGPTATPRALPALALFFAALMVSGPTTAQEFTPPTVSAVDGNGVDVISGQFTHSVTEVVIGPQGAGGLSYGRRYRGDRTSGTWRSSLSGTIQINHILGGLLFNAVVSIGDESATFNVSGTNYTPRSDKGASLTKSGAIYTYTSSAGVVARFSENFPASGSVARVLDITMPSGEVISYHYKSAAVGATTEHRLQAVTNNYGYLIHFEYEIDSPSTVQDLQDGFLTRTKATGINLAVDYCAPLANGCTGLTQSWPFVTYSRPNATTERVTNALGQNTDYIRSSADPNALIQIKRHSGEVAATITYQTGVNASVATVSTGGVTTTYGLAEEVSGSGGNSFIRQVTAPSTGLIKYTYSLSPRGINRVEQFNNPSFAFGNSRWVAYTRNAQSQITEMEDSNGRITQYAYDPRGNLTKLTRKARWTSGLADIVTEAGYASSCTSTNITHCNKPAWTKDAYGYITDYIYDPNHGGVTSVTAPAPSGAAPYGSGNRPETRFEYTARTARYKNGASSYINGTAIYVPTATRMCTSGNNSCAGQARETVVISGYESAAVPNNILVTSVTTKAGDNSVTSSVTTGWDALARPSFVDGPLLGTADRTYLQYDALGRVLVSASPDPDGGGALKYPASRTTYDSDGFVTKVEQGTLTGATSWASFSASEQRNITYDSFGRLIEERYAVGSTTHALTQISYNAAGRLDCAATRTVFAGAPSSACTQGTGGQDRITRNDYNDYGDITRVQTGYGTPLVQDTRTLTYTDWGALATLTDARGNLTRYFYDGFGRPGSTAFPDKTTAGTHAANDYTIQSYDPIGGRVTTLLLRSGLTLTFAYDNLGRLTQKTPSSGKAVAYAYDQAGRTTQVKFTDNSYIIDAVFDALGRNTRVTESGAKVSGANRVIDYGYDAASRRTSITHPDSAVFDYSYDVLNRMTLVRLAGAELAAFAYDDRARRIQVDVAQGDVYTDYTYADDSALERLSHDLAAGGIYDITIDYTHNAFNQITKADYSSLRYLWWPTADVNDSYTVNGLNQYTDVGGSAITYDDNGNLTGDGIWTFAYDAENRLTSASTSGTTATYEYDPLGRRSAKVVNGLRTEFLYDGASVIMEYDGSGTILRRYVYGLGADERLFYYEGDTTAETARYAIHTDHLGSTIALTDQNGALHERFSYGPFGETSDTSGCAFRYTGRYLDAETGLYYYRNRYYSPDLGRFLSPDPIGYEGGMNLYAYTGNDPVNFRDPTGLLLEEIVVTGRRPGCSFGFSCFGADSFFFFRSLFDRLDFALPGLGGIIPGGGDAGGDENQDNGESEEECVKVPPGGDFQTTLGVMLGQNLDRILNSFVFETEASFGIVAEFDIRLFAVLNAGAGIDAGTFRASIGADSGFNPGLKLTQGAFAELFVGPGGTSRVGPHFSIFRSGAVGLNRPDELRLANQPFQVSTVPQSFFGVDLGASLLFGGSVKAGFDLDKLDLRPVCSD